MSFIIKNISPNVVDINDLGLSLEIDQEIDLVEEASKDVAISTDLIDAINTDLIIVLDPIDYPTPLSKLLSVEAIQSANDPHFRIRGGELNQLDDVEASTLIHDYVLTYDNGTSKWISKQSQGGGSGGDSSSVRESVTQVGHSLTTGMPIYFNGTNWLPAQANLTSTIGTAIADVTGVDTFDVVSDGDIKTMSGLISGEWYYVDQNNIGTLTDIEPNVGISNPIGYAESSTQFHVVSIRASLISANVEDPARKLIVQPSHGFIDGTPIYFNGSIWNAAKADTSTTLATFVVQYVDDDSFEAISVGNVTGLTSLIPGDWYFVSQTNIGELITPEPTSGISNPIGFAESSTILYIMPMRAVDYT